MRLTPPTPADRVTLLLRALIEVASGGSIPCCGVEGDIRRHQLRTRGQ